MALDADHRRLQRYHAMRRYRERYGVSLTDWDYRAITGKVFRFLSSGASDGVEPTSHPCTYFVRVGALVVIARWDERTLQIATFVPTTEPLTARPDARLAAMS